MDVLELPFDQYQRYRLVADLVERLRDGGPPLRLLDVGGRTALLREFLDGAHITLVDVEESDEPGLVLGDGGALPFRDRAFDAVCAFDTLEHVPPEFRTRFVSECRRVSAKWVFLAGPYDAPRVAESEEILQAFLKDKLRTRHRYLEEHRLHGLPDRERTEAELRAMGGEVVSYGHANLDRWLVLMCLAMYLDDDPALRGLAKRFHRFYNASLYASDHAEPVYRHMVVAAFDGAPVPAVDGLLDPPRAPEGSLSGLQGLLEGLVAFDTERDAWREERERLRKVAADLEDDLAGHRESLDEANEELKGQAVAIAELRRELEAERAEGAAARATLESDLAEHKQTVAALERALEDERAAGGAARAELEADLAEHRALVAAVRAEAEAARATAGELEELLESERAGAAEVRSALEADLAEHRKVVERLRSDLEEHARLLADLERSRAEVEGVARSVQAELAKVNEAAAELNGTLGARDAELAEARAEIERLHGEIAWRNADLRSRKKNLKRAFAWKKPSY